MQATLRQTPVATSPAAAIARLRVLASEVIAVHPADSPQSAYARTLSVALDTLDVCRLNGHVALIGELWQTARLAHARLESL
jgi:hypothetical protein